MSDSYQTTLTPLSLDAPDGDAKALLEKAQANYGMIPNMFAGMANYPVLLETYMNGYGQLHVSGGFTPAELDIVLLTVSRENSCEYCTAAHSFSGDVMSQVPKDVTDAIRDGKEIPDPKLKALNAFTLAMMRKKGRLSPADAEKFKAAGFTDKHMMSVILAIAIKTISNFTNHLFHTSLEPMMASRTETKRSNMKTIGLVGGISWVSTGDYYKYINEGVNETLGGLNFARLIIHSMNYGDIIRNNEAGDWDANLNLLAEAAENMKAGGAQAIVLCANTMHLLAKPLEEKINLPVIHIAEATADEILKKKLKKMALLGTKFTMEKTFFTDKLKEKNIEVIIPGEADREFIHRTIFEELGRGIISDDTKAKYISIIHNLQQQGAEGVILGCTEIPLLIKQEDVSIPVFDTTKIHSDAAVRFMTSN